MIPSLRKLTDALHQNSDVKVFCQINHAGRRTTPEVTGSALMVPSPIEDTLKKGTVPQEMTVDQIHRVTEQFVRAAARVKAAGYDGVEIHSAHGYLLNQFYSPYSNRRTDEYGPQNMKNRLRFLTEVYRAIRKEVGTDYPVTVRMGGCDYLPGGSMIDDAAEASKLLEKDVLMRRLIQNHDRILKGASFNVRMGAAS